MLERNGTMRLEYYLLLREIHRRGARKRHSWDTVLADIRTVRRRLAEFDAHISFPQILRWRKLANERLFEEDEEIEERHHPHHLPSQPTKSPASGKELTGDSVR